MKKPNEAAILKRLDEIERMFDRKGPPHAIRLIGDVTWQALRLAVAIIDGGRCAILGPLIGARWGPSR
jgi:hypothetical protein